MFSSDPSSQFPSSTNVFSPPNSFLDYEEDDVHFNYHQLPIDNPFYISNDFLFPPEDIDVATLKQDFILQQQYSEDHNNLLDSVISSYKKKMVTSKRDGHSKISTARGLRDRRVRLSIDISRKLFCLQDLLGFDKASKTLDWLLTKSLTAIKDLVEQTNNCSSSTLTDESKAKFLETIKGGSDEQNGKKSKSLLKCVDGKGKKKKKKKTQRSKGGSEENLSRGQSRAEARARARERTKQKSRVKKLDDCCQIELQNGYKDISSECVMAQESSKQT